MTVEELRALLEDLPDDMEVMIAYQPEWPLRSQSDAHPNHDQNILYIFGDGETDYLKSGSGVYE